MLKKLTTVHVNACYCRFGESSWIQQLEGRLEASDGQLFERERRVRGLTNWLWQ